MTATRQRARRARRAFLTKSPTQDAAWTPMSGAKITIKISTNQLLNQKADPKQCHNECLGEIFCRSGGEEKNYPVDPTREKLVWVRPALEGLSPVALDRLDDAFPRDRFLALDIETTGLSAADDRCAPCSSRTARTSPSWSSIAPSRRTRWLYWPISSAAAASSSTTPASRAAWLRQAGIDLVLDDTALLFAAVRGTRLPRGENGGRVSLAALAAMMLDETLDKSEQTSDWAAPTLTASQLAYALNDAIVTHRIWEALRAELHRKSDEQGSISPPAMRICASPPPWRASWSARALASTSPPTRLGSRASASRRRRSRRISPPSTRR